MVLGNFAGQDLSGNDFTNQDLRGTNFSRARLFQVTLNNADLSPIFDPTIGTRRVSNFSSALLDSVSAIDTNFRAANFSEANLVGGTFDRANFTAANLSLLSAQGAPSFIGTNFTRADLTRATLGGAIFIDSVLRNADFRGADIGGSVIAGQATPLNARGINLSAEFGTNVTGLFLYNVDFTGGNFEGIGFTDTNRSLPTVPIAGPNGQPLTQLPTDFNLIFDSANLRNVAIEDVNLSGSSFVGADLTGASIPDAQFDRSNFSNAILAGVRGENTGFASGTFNGTQFFAANPVDPANPLIANLPSSDFSNATILGADARQAFLSLSDFSGARIEQTNFSGANLNGISANGVANGVFENTTLFRGVNLEAANLGVSNFTDTRFVTTDLTNLGPVSDTTFTDTVFRNVDFTGTRFIGNSSFNNVRFEGTITGFDFTGLNPNSIDITRATLVNPIGLPPVVAV